MHACYTNTVGQKGEDPAMWGLIELSNFIFFYVKRDAG